MLECEKRFMEKYRRELEEAAKIVESKIPEKGIPAKDFEYHATYAKLKLIEVLRLQPEVYEIIEDAREQAIKKLRDAINYCVFAILSLEPEASYVRVVVCEHSEDCPNLECRHRGKHDHGDDCNPCGLKCKSWRIEEGEED